MAARPRTKGPNRWAGLSIALALCATALSALFAVPASATVLGSNPCSGQPSYAWMGDSVAASVTIPSLSGPDGATSYDGTVFRPADIAAYPGPRPLVVFAHGINGGKCSLFWAAQEVAGHGYVAIILSAGGTKGDQLGQVARGIDAQRSSIAFARSAANPFRPQTDGTHIAVAGFSLGSIVTSVDQQDAATDPAIKTAVAFDTLRTYVIGDPGGVNDNCQPPSAGLIRATVPALSFASDNPCGANPGFAPADLKLTSFRRWRGAGMPVSQLVMRGFQHTDYAAAGDETQHRDVAHYVEAWLARYLRDDTGASRALAAETVNGRATTDILSTTFLSGAFLRDLGVNTEDLGGYLAANGGPPDTRRLNVPRGRITPRRIRRHRLKFHFGSTQEDVTLHCKFDRRAYVPCSSPFVLRRVSVRRHVIRVLGTDPGGLVEAAPAIWRFRVVRDRVRRR